MTLGISKINDDQDQNDIGSANKQSATLNNEDCLQNISKIPNKLKRKKIPKIQNNSNENQSNEIDKQNDTFFKRKYTKTKKIIGEKDGSASQNRIMISTSGSCQAKRGKHAVQNNQNKDPMESDRKALKSAQPIRNAYQENLKRRMTNNANNQTSLETRIGQQLKNDSTNRGVSVENRTRRNKNLNIKKKQLVETKNSDKYCTNDYQNKRKLLEKDVKNIKIVDYFSESRKLNNPKCYEDSQSNAQNSLVLFTENTAQNNYLFSEGTELKSGLIDVTKAYDLMKKTKSSYDKNRRDFSSLNLKNDKKRKINNQSRIDPSGDSIDLVPSNEFENTSSQGHKWSKILEYMKKNPKVLMDAIPSPKPEEKLK